MKMCHVVIVCSLMIMDLPVLVRQCDPSEVATYGRRQGNTNKTSTNDRDLSVERAIRGIFQRTLFPHSYRVRKSMAVLWFSVLVTVLPPVPDQNAYKFWLILVIHDC